MNFTNFKKILPKKYKTELYLAELEYKDLFSFLQKVENNEQLLLEKFSESFINTCKNIKNMITDYNNPIIRYREEGITAPEKLFTYCRDKIGDKDKEFMLGLALNSNNQIIQTKMLFEGTVSTCNIYPREILKFLLDNNATGLFLVHNHPSGKVTPSNDDISITRKLEEMLKDLEIRFLDHLIITQEEGYSIKAQRYIHSEED